MYTPTVAEVEGLMNSQRLMFHEVGVGWWVMSGAALEGAGGFFDFLHASSPHDLP
jgi:hypothetical protein